MITRARIAELRKTWPQDMQSAELDEVLDAAESAIDLRAKLDAFMDAIEVEDGLPVAVNWNLLTQAIRK